VPAPALVIVEDSFGRYQKTYPQERAEVVKAQSPPAGESPKIVSATLVSGQQITVLDLQNMRDVVEDTAAPDLAINFLNDFIKLLQVRLSRIRGALSAEDFQACVTAVLSLRDSSVWVGGPGD
jgi:hypothetical protein